MAGSILACGAWLKNAACRLDATDAAWSPLHGDLGDPQACRALDDSVQALARAAPGGIVALAHDLHPDFFSTRLAQRLAAQWGVPAIGVQHHHAHVGVVMADHALQEPVIGLALDGVGLGTDGSAWGGELLQVAPGSWRRLGALEPLRLPGGDVAAREPWRMAAAVLHGAGRGSEIEARFAAAVGTPAARLVAQMLARGVHCPETTSTGRWFDAAAALLGLSVRQGHEAEAAIALEQAAAARLARGPFTRALADIDPTDPSRLELGRLALALVADDAGDVEEAAAWFHLSLARALADWAALAARAAGVRVVALSGGCFFNRVLAAEVSARIARHGLRPLAPRTTSCGDAGLALGQAWVARQGAPSPAGFNHGL